MDRGGIGDNGGPPLEDEHVPPWGRGDPFVYLAWAAAHRRAWREVPWDIMLHRQRRAEALGLTYEEYTLELLERGRHLSPLDEGTVAAVKRRRPKPQVLDGRVVAATQHSPPPDREGRPWLASPAYGLMKRAAKRYRSP